MAKQKTPTLAQVCAILDHDRCEVGWLLAAYADPQTGLPRIDRITRIGIVRPRDGAGRLKVCVTDWTGRAGDPTHYIGQASGYGYDKLTAALDGATIAGRVVSDHGGSGAAPTWKQWIDRLRYGDPTPDELAPIRLHLGLPDTAPVAFHYVGGF